MKKKEPKVTAYIPCSVEARFRLQKMAQNKSTPDHKVTVIELLEELSKLK